MIFSNRKIRVGLLLLLLTTALFFLLFKSETSFRPEETDFSQYWSAERAALAGLNPYSPEVMLNEQKKLDPSRTQPVMMWNPPLTILLLAPFASWDYTLSYNLWFAANVLFLILSALIVSRYYSGNLQESSPGLIIASLLLFYPAWNNVLSGQIGLFMTLGLVAFLWFEKKGQYFLAGLSLLPLSVKPHLFFPVWIALGWIAIKERGVWILHFLGALGAMCILTEIVFPGITENWLYSFGQTASDIGYVRVREWKSDTLVSFIRELSVEMGERIDWPMWAVPLGAVAILSARLLLKNRKLSLSHDMPLLLAFSLLTAPYGWCSDFSLLILSFAYGIMLGEASGSKRITISATVLFVIINTGYFAYSLLSEDSHQWIFMFPAVSMFFIYFFRLSAGTKTTQSF